MASPNKVNDLIRAAVGEAAFDEIRAQQALRKIRELIKERHLDGTVAELISEIEHRIAIGLGEIS